MSNYSFFFSIKKVQTRSNTGLLLNKANKRKSFRKTIPAHCNIIENNVLKAIYRFGHCCSPLLLLPNSL